MNRTPIIRLRARGGRSPRARRLVPPALLALVGLVLFGFASPAQADSVSQIASGLRSSKLYVSAEAQSALSRSAQATVRRALNHTHHTDIRVVVTKAGVGQQQLGRMLNAVRQRVGEGDTYIAITADNKMLGISRKLSGLEINQLIARTAGGDIESRLIKFAHLADAKVTADHAPSSQAPSSETPSGQEPSPALLSFFLVMLGAVGFGLVGLVVAGFTWLVVIGPRQQRLRNARKMAELNRQMAELKQSAQEDVTRLGEDITALDLDLMDPNLDPQTRGNLTQSLNSYERAKAAAESARVPDDMRAAATALEDGRYYLTAVHALQAGLPIPERRAPCFFNPQHGPSVQVVPWTPMAGIQSRPVPACAMDARAVLNGMRPDARLVTTRGQRVPYWDAGPAYAPYAGGYYAGFGGMTFLRPLVIGTALGSVIGISLRGSHSVFHSGHHSAGDDVFSSDSGDIGGGWDFGSGDFGGDSGGDSGGDF